MSWFPGLRGQYYFASTNNKHTSLLPTCD